MTKCRRAKMTRGENNPVYSKCSISEIPYEILCHYYKILLNANNNFNLYEHKSINFFAELQTKIKHALFNQIYTPYAFSAFKNIQSIYKSW